MSLQATQDDQQTGEKGAMNGSGAETAKAEKEEVAGPSTAVIQMTIQPQTASADSVTVSTEPIGVVLAELPQALLDIVPTEEGPVQPAVSTSAYEYVDEREEPLVPLGSFGARPAFSYRTEAALMHHYSAADSTTTPARSAHTYDYIDEGEFALEQALAAIVQASPSGRGGEVPAGGVPPGAPPAPLPAPPSPPASPLDPAALYHELEREFNLEGVQMQSNPPSVEYSENGATLQSELFELGQGGAFCSGSGLEAPVEEVIAEAAPAPPASEADLPLPDLPAESSPNDQPGPSRPRAHAVQLYPSGGEGEPHTCYITNLPALAIEPTFFDDVEGVDVERESGGSMLQQARPLPSTSRDDDMLRQLLGANPDDEGEVPSSPAASQNTFEDSSEPDKANKPDTISAALRSAAISFASFHTDDSQTIENAAALVESQAAPDACLCPDDNNEANEPPAVAQAEAKDDEERKATSNTGTEDVQAEEMRSIGLVASLTSETDSNSMSNTLSEEEGLILSSENKNDDSPTGEQEITTLSEAMGRLFVSEPFESAIEPDSTTDIQTTETEAAEPGTSVEDIKLETVEEKEKVSSAGEDVAAEEIAPIEESDHTSERPTTPAVEALSSEEVEPAPIASTQAGDNVSDCVAQVEVETPKQLVTVSEANEPTAVNVVLDEHGADTDAIATVDTVATVATIDTVATVATVATIDTVATVATVATIDTVATVDTVDSTASTARKPPVSPKKRKVATPGTAQVKSKKSKKFVSGANKKPVASGSTAAAALVPAKPKLMKRKSSAKQAAASKTASPLKAKTVRKVLHQGQSTSESTVSSEDSNDSKTLATIIAECKAAAAAVKGQTAATAATSAISAYSIAASAATAATAAIAASAATAATAATATIGATAAIAGAAAIARADADAATALAAPAMSPAQQASSQKAKGKRSTTSAQYGKPSKSQSKKARPAEVPTTTMVLRSRSHLI